jgi:uncharacterized YigZ family protein
MSELGLYKTIQEVSTGFYKEKGSKFFAFAFPCENEFEIKEHIAKLRKEHFQAVHVCSAFRLGSDMKLYRSSDDGEPSNSAGPPILGQIQAYNLTNILIAVVRYYGGTNLGVGGLINAYRTAAKDALNQAIIIEKEDYSVVSLSFSYETMPDVMRLIKSHHIEICKQDFGLTCKLDIQLTQRKMSFLEDLRHYNTVNQQELIAIQEP